MATDYRKHFSKVLYIVTLHSIYARALTFENLSSSAVLDATHVVAPLSDDGVPHLSYLQRIRLMDFQRFIKTYAIIFKIHPELVIQQGVCVCVCVCVCAPVFSKVHYIVSFV